MPGSGGEGFDGVDDFSNVGGVHQTTVAYQVNMDLSFEEFSAHLEQCNINYKGQMMKKFLGMSEMEITMLNKKVSAPFA